MFLYAAVNEAASGSHPFFDLPVILSCHRRSLAWDWIGGLYQKLLLCSPWHSQIQVLFPLKRNILDCQGGRKFEEYAWTVDQFATLITPQ